MKKYKNIVLLILDGWGYNEEIYGNAVKQANTQVFDMLWEKYPHTLLKTSGNAVGLPEGQMGTSEVNHMVMGAGRVIYQDLEKINQDIKNDRFRENKSIVEAMEYIRDSGNTLHLQGLLSDGGVHSHQQHWYAILSMAKKIGVENVVVHIFTDGRDTPPKSAIRFVSDLQEFMSKLGLGEIATISGRYYAMDRNNNWDRIEKAYKVIVKSEGETYKSPVEAIEKAYEKGQTDEFMEPVVIESKEGEKHAVGTDDAVIFINFRTDRAKEITRKMLEDGAVSKDRFVAMTQYDDKLDCQIAYPQETISNTLGETISKNGLTQLRISETEKFNHVTYFLNCRKSNTLEGEDRILLDSYSDIPYDEKPEMRASDITRELIQDINDKVHNFTIANLCNADMIGHTGNLEAAITAIEVLDESVEKIYNACRENDYALIITADHGNAEEMLYPDGTPETSHSKFPVPFILTLTEFNELYKPEGGAGLKDLAPTILTLMDLDIPEEMTGESLVKEAKVAAR